MRIQFANLGHAHRCLKICKQLLQDELPDSRSHRLSSNRVRDAFCLGFGYGSYTELANVLASHPLYEPPKYRHDFFEALEKGFRCALRIAHDAGFRFSEAADSIARRLTSDCVHLLDSSAPGKNEAVCLPPPRPIFYRTVIERRRFHAGLSVDGPYVADEEDDVQIGVSCIVELPTINPISTAATSEVFKRIEPIRPFFVVKYGRQKRIRLTSLSDAGRQEFSQKFGVPFGEYPHGLDDHGDSFFRSAAFQALVKWVKSHPKAAGRLALIEQYYVPKLLEKLETATGLPLVSQLNLSEES